jgi:uncharacterized alkaline shock family protein YloU
MSLVIANEHGTITVPEGVLVDLAVEAAERVDGLKVRRKRAVDAESRVVRLTVSVRRGEPLVELAQRAQDEVVSTFEQVCGIEPTVEISIAELE